MDFDSHQVVGQPRDFVEVMDDVEKNLDTAVMVEVLVYSPVTASNWSTA